jgi:preprotein translocase subunit SecD
VLRGWFLAAGLLVASAAVAAAEPLSIEIARAQVGFDQRTNEPVISFRMSEASKRAFADFATKNVGRKVEIRVDGRALVAPVIREPILGGMGQISAGLKVDEARDLADRLSSGRAKMEVEAVAD